VLTVIFTLTTDPLGVTEEGENVQVAPPGKLVQLNWTSLLKPLEGVKLTVYEAGAPETMVFRAGETESE
jgi:hypothetical protein